KIFAMDLNKLLKDTSDQEIILLCREWMFDEPVPYLERLLNGTGENSNYLSERLVPRQFN
ncbi:hypothetical protein NPIL_677171, partial [Nephila pilipes]